MTARLTESDYRELKARGLLNGAIVTGGCDEPKRWSNAQANTIRGIKFPSKCQARVYLRLVELFGVDNLRLDIRMPLLAGDKGNGKVLYQEIDFVVVENGKPKLWIDAKTKRKSREWARGMALFRPSWGDVILWDGLGEFPK